MAEFEKVSEIDEIDPGGRKPIIVDDVPVLLLRVGDEFYAIEDVCTHDGAQLTGGCIENDVIVCPRHGARFSLETGAALTPPAYEAVDTFPVEVRDGLIYTRDDRWD